MVSLGLLLGIRFSLSLYGGSKEINITAIVLPKITCDLPVSPVPFDSSWSHISDLILADPAFGLPGKIDILLGVDVFVNRVGG